MTQRSCEHAASGRREADGLGHVLVGRDDRPFRQRRRGLELVRDRRLRLEDRERRSSHIRDGEAASRGLTDRNRAEVDRSSG